MRAMIVSAVMCSWLAAGCATSDHEVMTLQECSLASVCRIEGVLSVREIDHVHMGRLELPGGECVNVSLPPRDVRRIQREGPRHAIVEGRVNPSPGDDPNLMTLVIEGRRVGWHQCGDFYIFVRG